jgi:hypothetical protein
MPGERKKYVYWVHLLSRHGNDSGAFRLVFECEFATLEALGLELAQYGVVSGSRLFTTDDGQGGRTIVDRKEILFGAIGVITIQPYEWTVREKSQ